MTGEKKFGEINLVLHQHYYAGRPFSYQYHHHKVFSKDTKFLDIKLKSLLQIHTHTYR